MLELAGGGRNFYNVVVNLSIGYATKCQYNLDFTINYNFNALFCFVKHFTWVDLSLVLYDKNLVKFQTNRNKRSEEFVICINPFLFQN